MPLDLLALRVFHAALQAVPALVRHWYAYDCPRQVAVRPLDRPRARERERKKKKLLPIACRFLLTP